MIIVRSAFNHNLFLTSVRSLSDGPFDNDSGYGVILIGSARLLAELGKLYGKLPVNYIIADYGNYVFVNRINGGRTNDRKYLELDLLKTGIKYDVILEGHQHSYYRSIDIPEIANVPRLDVDFGYTHRNLNPLDVLPKLDEVFGITSENKALRQENEQLKRIIEKLEAICNSQA